MRASFGSGWGRRDLKGARTGHLRLLYNYRTSGLLQPDVRSPTFVDKNGASFCRWIGVEGESHNTRNFISILALGWSYILSVRFLEMQGHNDAEKVYTQSTATGYNYDTGDRKATAISVEISDMDMDEARWWAAIMASDQGWKAVGSQRDNGVYQPP
jgi:hypothetical protein